MSSARQPFGPLDLAQLAELQTRPAPFTPGEPRFWDDPHIATQMLAAHLNPTHDLASRRPETIARSVAWIVRTVGLAPGAAVLDLGCGPGLYAVRLAQQGLAVTGVDLSPGSIAYAEAQARALALPIRYRCENYLALAEAGGYDAALLIYGDYCVLAPDQRLQLLGNVRRALKPGGAFVLDVSTRAHRQRHGQTNHWGVVERGFWRPGPHLVLAQGFDDPERRLYLDQTIVIEADGALAVYRNWFQDFTGEAIQVELERAGFVVRGLWDDLCGAPYTAAGEWIGVIALASA